MIKWTKEKMEEVYSEIQEKAMTDMDFRKELLKDANKAVEELIGEPLPEGCKLKAVEQDPNYSATFVIPDLISDELSPDELDKVVGGESTDMVGLSILLIISVCIAAVSVAGCSGDICAAQVCAADMICDGKVCGTKGDPV